MKFAKVFDLENDEQVLVVKDYDNDEEKDIVRVSTDFDGSRVSLIFSFDDEKSQLKNFDSFDIQKAKDFRDTIESNFLK